MRFFVVLKSKIGLLKDESIYYHLRHLLLYHSIHLAFAVVANPKEINA